MTRPASKPKPSPASQEQVADKEIVREEPGVVLEDELPKSGTVHQGKWIHVHGFFHIVLPNGSTFDKLDPPLLAAMTRDLL